MNKETLKEYFEEFKRHKGHYPTSLEIDSPSFKGPSARTIQRNFGGLVKLRQDLGLEVTNYTTGEARVNMANKANNRHRTALKEVYEFLLSKFGEIRVHKEFPIDSPHSEKRCDFYVFVSDQKFLTIDCFYPSNKHSLYGCLNIKLKKHRKVKTNFLDRSTVIYINMNENLPNDVNLTSKFKPNEYLIHFSQLATLLKTLYNNNNEYHSRSN